MIKFSQALVILFGLIAGQQGYSIIAHGGIDGKMLFTTISTIVFFVVMYNVMEKL